MKYESNIRERTFAAAAMAPEIAKRINLEVII